MEWERAGSPKVGEINLRTQQKGGGTEGEESRYEIDGCGRSCSFDDRGKQ
jgi:hypothetical protein